ncbi:MAG: hypothetical protein OXT67_01355, partial [Zetaproteobacteria bacterium]|nr:hypothetical protein [Zetaproteobacteria bacterium]
SDFQHSMIMTETIGHLIDKYALMWYCTSQLDSPLKVENFRKSTAAWAQKCSVFSQNTPTELFNEKTAKLFLQVSEKLELLSVVEHTIAALPGSERCQSFANSWLSKRYTMM